MDVLRMVGTVLSGIAAVASMVAAVVVLRIKLEVSELRVYIEQARRQDREEVREWVEKHFQRAKGA